MTRREKVKAIHREQRDRVRRRKKSERGGSSLVIVPELKPKTIQNALMKTMFRFLFGKTG